jgi:hypothetical protein
MAGNSRARSFLITVSGFDGFFDTKTGGELSKGSRRYYNGGDTVPDVNTDPAEYSDLIVGRAFRVGRDDRMLRDARRLTVSRDSEHTVRVQPIDASGVPVGIATTYRGILVGATDPDADSNSGDPAKAALRFAVAEAF